jgi:hypothetical protein
VRGRFIIELTRQGRMDEMTVHAEARREPLKSFQHGPTVAAVLSG